MQTCLCYAGDGSPVRQEPVGSLPVELGEAPRVAHGRPDERLADGQHLGEVLAIVVDPLVQEV